MPSESEPGGEKRSRPQTWLSANPSIALAAVGVLLLAAGIATRSDASVASPLVVIGAAALILTPFGERIERLRAGVGVGADLGKLGKDKVDEGLQKALNELPELVRETVDLELARGTALAGYAQLVEPIRQTYATNQFTVQLAAGTAAYNAAEDAINRQLGHVGVVMCGKCGRALHETPVSAMDAVLATGEERKCPYCQSADRVVVMRDEATWGAWARALERGEQPTEPFHS